MTPSCNSLGSSAICKCADISEAQEFLIGSDERQVEHLRGRGKEAIRGIPVEMQLMSCKRDLVSERSLAMNSSEG